MITTGVNLGRFTVEAVWEYVVTPYVESGGEWIVSSLMYRPESYTQHILRLAEAGSGRWERTNSTMPNKTLVITLGLVRSSGYYIYNLVVPLIVLVVIQLATILVPANSEDKPPLLLAVMLPFFFYQVYILQYSVLFRISLSFVSLSLSHLFLFLAFSQRLLRLRFDSLQIRIL